MDTDTLYEILANLFIVGVLVVPIGWLCAMMMCRVAVIVWEVVKWLQKLFRIR